MPPLLALFFGVSLVLWLLWRDFKVRSAGSPALWIPAIYLLIVSSRAVGFWFGTGATSKIEGSPFDRLVSLFLIFGAVLVLMNRGLDWGAVISRNKMLCIVLLYLLVSTLWAYFPLVSFKRWTKLLGGVLIALALLSEERPLDTIRILFVRCSYLLFPLSVVTAKYFPNIGMCQDKGWSNMISGLCEHKNSLGRTVMVLGLMLIWDFLETRHRESKAVQRALLPNFVAAGFCGLWLLYKCQSRTAVVCFILGVLILWGTKYLLRSRQPGKTLAICAAGMLVLLGAEKLFGLSDVLFEMLGRSKNLTGRTDIWELALRQDVNSLIGCGFYGFWDSPRAEEVLDYININQAHNGYLETYLNGGLLGVALLALLLGAGMVRLYRRLFEGSYWARISFMFGAIVLVYNLSEADFFREENLWFTFLLAVIECRRQHETVSALTEAEEGPVSGLSQDSAPVAAGVSHGEVGESS